MANKSYIIKVKLYTDAEVSLAVKASDSIADIKKKIEAKTGDNASYLIIKDVNDNILASGRKLSDYNIRKGCNLIASRLHVQFDNGEDLTHDDMAAAVTQMEGGEVAYPVAVSMSATTGGGYSEEQTQVDFEEMRDLFEYTAMGKGKGKIQPTSNFDEFREFVSSNGKSHGKGKQWAVSHPFQGQGHRLDENDGLD